MYNVSADYQKQIKSYMRELKARIHFGSYLLEDEILSIKVSLTSNLKTSIMGNVISQSAEIELKNTNDTLQIKKGDVFSFDIGILLENKTIEYVPYQQMFVDTVTEGNDKKITIKAFDFIQYFNSKLLNEVTISYPITTRKYLNKISQALGLTVSPKYFYNDNISFSSYPNFSGSETLRDVLGEISTFALGNVFINRNGEIEIKSLLNTDISINSISANEYNKLEKGEVYGPINSVVLSRTPQEDNIYRRDEADIALNGLHEIKIENNAFFDKIRDACIDGVFENLKGLTYVPLNAECRGDPALDVCDCISLIDVDGIGINKTYVFSQELFFTGGLKSSIKVESPNDTSTSYKKATNLKERIKNAEITVDKVNNTINSIVENTYTKDEVDTVVKTSIEQTSNSIKLEVSEIYSTQEEVSAINTATQEILSNKIEFNFTSTEKKTEDLKNSVETNAGIMNGNQKLIEDYIRFKGALIELGRTGNAFTAELSNTELSFKQNNVKIAYISNNKLYITDVEIKNKLTLGSQTNGYFDWIPRQNGNLTLKWRG